MSCTRVYEWHEKFKSGHDDMEDDPKPGRLTTSKNYKNIQNVNEPVHSDRRMTVRMLAEAEELGLGRTILTEDLGMKKICAKMVPNLLSDDQKARCVDLSRNVLVINDDLTLSKAVIIVGYRKARMEEVK